MWNLRPQKKVDIRGRVAGYPDNRQPIKSINNYKYPMIQLMSELDKSFLRVIY